jgi:hypothetical protein
MSQSSPTPGNERPRPEAGGLKCAQRQQLQGPEGRWRGLVSPRRSRGSTATAPGRAHNSGTRSLHLLEQRLDQYPEGIKRRASGSNSAVQLTVTEGRGFIRAIWWQEPKFLTILNSFTFHPSTHSLHIPTSLCGTDTMRTSRICRKIISEKRFV